MWTRINRYNWKLILVLVITGLAYSNILQNDFVWDDFYFIKSWPVVRDLTVNWVDLWLGKLPVGEGYLYRPVRGLWQGLGIWLWGEQPVGYHLTAIGIQVLATYLVYLIIKQITHQSRAALIGSLIFGVHPVHVEQITWITSTFDTIGSVWFMAAFYWYLKADSEIAAIRKKRLRTGSIIAAGLATFTYELTLVLPLLIVWYELVLNRKKHGWMSLVKISGWYWFWFVTYWGLRWIVLPGTDPVEQILNNRMATFGVMVAGLVKYLQLLIWPENLTINHHLFGNVTAFYHLDASNQQGYLFPGLLTPPILTRFIGLLVIWWLTIKSIKKYPMAGLGLGWIFISLIPVLQFIPQKMIFAEKYLYIASTGYSLLVGLLANQLIFWLTNLRVRRNIATGLIATGVIIYSGCLWNTTYNYNRIWKNNLTLWSHAHQQTPTSAYINNNLAGSYFLDKQYEEAVKKYEAAIDLIPNDVDMRIRLAYTLIQVGDEEKAIQALNQAKKLDKQNYIIFNLLGDAYLKTGQIELAILNYMESQKINPADTYAQEKLELMVVDNF